MAFTPSNVADAKRKTLTIGSADYPSSAETDFPVAIPISGSVGKGSFDASGFFDELKFDPSHISTELWLDADDSTTISTDTGVDQWSDKSGNARHVSQTTGANQPTVNSGNQNGKDTISFDGTSNYLYSTSPFLYNTLTGCSVFIVIEADAAGTSDYVIAEGSSSSANPIYAPIKTRSATADDFSAFVRNDADVSLYNSDGDFSTAIGSSFLIYSFHDSQSAFTTYQDGTKVADAVSYTRSGTLTLDRFSIGALLRSSAGNHINADIAEIIVVDGVTSDATREKIEGYLAHKWGLTSDLPSSHPWKDKHPVSYKKLSIEADGTQCPVEVSPNEWVYEAMHPSTVFLLNSDTTDESTTFADESGNDHTITTNTNSKHDDTETKYGSTSIYFDGSDSELELASHADFQFGTGAWTICGWINTADYSSDTGNRRVIAFGANASVAPQIFLDTTADGHLFVYANSTSLIEGTSDVANGDWVHFAATHDGTTLRLFINGSQEGSVANSYNFTCDSTIYIGGYSDGTKRWNGYMQGIQIVKGAALWTSNFTPPAFLVGHGKAVLYTKIPSVSSSADTELVLSYDSSQDDNDTYVGLTGESDTTDLVTAASSTGHGGIATDYNWRLVIDSSEIAAQNGGLHVCISFLHHGTNYTVNNLYIWKQASSGDDYDGEPGTSEQILLGGATSFTITSDGQLSDPITMEIDGTDTLVLAYHTTNSMPYLADSATFSSYSKSGSSESSTADVSSYVAGSNRFVIKGIVQLAPNLSIWDSNFKAVYHMAQDPSGGTDCILDSTINANHGTPSGSMTGSDLVDASVGKGIDFDGTDDFIDCGSDSSLNATDITVEALVEANTQSTNAIVVSRSADGSTDQFMIRQTDAELFDMEVYDSSPATEGVSSTAALVSGWQYIAGTYEVGTGTTVFENGTAKTLDTTPVTTLSFTQKLIIGAQDYAAARRYYNNPIAEIRLSNVVRSADYITLTNKSLTDSLFTWAAYETPAGGPIDYQLDLTIAARSEILTDFPVPWEIYDDQAAQAVDNRVSIFNKVDPIMKGEGSVVPTNHYTMDNITGSTLTDEKGNINGTISNMTQTEGGVLGGKYLAGGAIDSTARYVDFGSGTELSFKSISCWVKRIDTLDNSDVFFNASAASFIQIVRSDHGTLPNKVLFTSSDTGLTISDTTNWHHLVIVEGTNNNTHWAFVDGVKASAEVSSGFGGIFRYIGRGTTGAGTETANIDNVQVYDVVLTDAQIRELYFATKPSFRTDQIHADTVLYIESNHPDGSQEFIDLSDSVHQITVNGDTHHDTGQSKNSQSAIYLDGSGDYLSIADSTDWDMGTGDFTWRTRVLFPSAQTYNPIMGQTVDDNNRCRLHISTNGSNSNNFYCRVGGTTLADYTWSYTWSTGVWYDIEVCRSGSNIYIFVNNVSQSLTVNTAIGSNDLSGISGSFYIGYGRQGGGWNDGLQYYEYVQIIKGTALHTTDFTPPICLPSCPDYRKLIIKNSTPTQLYTEVDVWEPKEIEPIAHYTMDRLEGTTTLIDEKGNYPGTISNMTATADGKWAGSDYLAGGGNDSVSRDVDFGASGISFKTWAGWIKLVDTADRHTILTDAGVNSTLYVRDDGDSSPNCLTFYDGSGANISNLTIDESTSWHLVVITEGASNNSHWIWLDGVKASSALTSNFAGAIRYLAKGAVSSDESTPHFDGIQIFDVVLTERQIAQLYAAGSPSEKCGPYAAGHTKATLGTSETVLTCNFDPTNVDQSSYVGIVGESAAQSVWNSGYAARYSMGQIDTLLDSTANANDGTKTGTPTLEYSGGFGNRVLFAENDYFDIGNDSGLNPDDGITLEALLEPNEAYGYNAGIFYREIINKDAVWTSNGYSLNYYINSNNDNNYIQFFSRDGACNHDEGYQVDVDWRGQNKYLAGAAEIGDNTMYEDGASLTLSTDTAATAWSNNTKSVRIAGEHGNGATDTGFVGYISEVRISTVMRSAEWIAATNDGLTDSLITFSQSMAVGGYLPRLAFYNLMYGNAVQAQLQYWNEVYHMTLARVQYIDAIYGVQIQKFFELYYGDSTVLQKWWDEQYGDKPLLTGTFDLPYGNSNEMVKFWNLVYALRPDRLQYWDEKYAVAGNEVLAFFNIDYAMLTLNERQRFFDMMYNVAANSVIEYATTFTLDGVRVYPVHFSFEFNKSSYKATAEAHFAEQDIYEACKHNESVFRMQDPEDGLDITWQVAVPYERLQRGRQTYVVPMESKCRVLERATPLNQDYGPGMASEICIAIAAAEGINITWLDFDWYIPANRLTANDETPYQVIHRVTQAVKLIKQPTLDGDLVVRRARAVDTDKYDDAVPSYYLTELLNFFTTSETVQEKKGYNKYHIKDHGIGETRTWLEEEEVNSTTKILKGYRVPFDEKELRLYTSSIGITIEAYSVEYETLVETIEIVEGEGKVSKPIYNLINDITVIDGETHVTGYHDTNLGAITYLEDGTIYTNTAGQSLLKIVYETKWWKWTAKDEQIEKVQFWVEAV